MVVACLSSVNHRYQYVVETEDGTVLLEPFFTVADPIQIAQHVANSQGENVRLEMRNSEPPYIVRTFQPARPRRQHRELV